MDLQVSDGTHNDNDDSRALAFHNGDDDEQEGIPTFPPTISLCQSRYSKRPFNILHLLISGNY